MGIDCSAVSSCYIQPDVVELRQQMTPSMTAIQIAVLDIMKACVTELKRCNSSVSFHSVPLCMHMCSTVSIFLCQFQYWTTASAFVLSMQLDTDEVTVENSMSKSFDQIIKLQLDPVWNQLVSVASHTSIY